MPTKRPVYNSFQLDTLAEEERLRFVLSVLSVCQLYQVAGLVKAVQKTGYGEVSIVIENGAPFTVTTKISEKVRME
jgi:hypothetical protein